MQKISAQNTYDHIIGSGALSYGWYLPVEIPDDPESTGADTWMLRFKELDDDGETGREFTVTHEDIVRAIRKLAGKDGADVRYLTSVCRQECRHLLFDRDAADFDSATADEVIQFAVFGQIIYG